MDVAASAQSVVPNWRGLMPSAFDARSSRGAADQTQRRCLSIQYGKAPSDESFSEFRNFVVARFIIEINETPDYR
jgi:hypothetical protein